MTPTRRSGRARPRARAAATLLAIAAATAAPAPACAWVLTLTPGSKQLFLMVGNGTAGASSATINSVSVTVPAASVGNGTSQAMTSDSTQAASPFDGFAVCSPPAQVFVGASYRQPNGVTGNATATLQVSTPPSLTSGGDAIPFSGIGWTSTANGNPAADIPAGAFNGGTVFLASIARNTAVENCLAFFYANSQIVPAGTFTGRAVFTLSVP
jgi:hypothetical protein